jgi:hypothetical protein
LQRPDKLRLQYSQANGTTKARNLKLKKHNILASASLESLKDHSKERACAILEQISEERNQKKKLIKEIRSIFNSQPELLNPSMLLKREEKENELIKIQ